MNILILGGNSRRHKDWVRQVASALESPDANVVFLDYLHWASDASEFADIPVEVDRAAELAKRFDGDYIIIAKSVGTGITLIGQASGKLRPSRCVFLGFPLKGILEDDKKFGYVEAFKVLSPTVIVQNDHDPWGSAIEVQQFVTASGNNAVKVVTTPGDTHDYIDFELIRKLALEQ